jgi:MFS transporter, SP family, sugar:H+ symporter
MSTAGSASGAGAPEARQTTSGKAIAIAVAAAIGGFLFGFDSAVINGAVEAIEGQFSLTPFLSGFAVACALLGSAVGAWYAGPLADRYGRIRVMVIAAVLFAVSALGSGFAFTVWDLILWRVVGGLAIGGASVIAPTYIAEIAPAHIRGRLASLQQLAIVTGIFVALLSDAFFANAAGSASNPFWFGIEAWRWMFLAELVPAVVYGVLALRIPESPRFLVAQGETTRAGQVLREVLSLRSSEAVDEKVASIRLTMEREDKPSLRDLLGPRLGLKPIVWVGILLSVFQQFVGINVIFYYSTTLWRSVGFSESESLTYSVINSLVNLVSTVIAILIVDKVGRKPMLLGGSIGMTITLGVMAVCFSQATGTGDDVTLPGAYGTVALIAANLFVVSFAVTWGPVVWVLLGEIFANWLRAAALAVAAAAQWVANFVITVTFPVLADLGLTFAYGLYALFALISFVFVYRAVSETKGMELEDMVA